MRYVKTAAETTAASTSSVTDTKASASVVSVAATNEAAPSVKHVPSVRVFNSKKVPKAVPHIANTVETTSTASPSKVPALRAPTETTDTTDASKTTSSAAPPLTFFASPPATATTTSSADALLAATSEGSSNEGAQTASRVFRRPHRSAQKRTKRSLAAAALANANATCPYRTYSSHDPLLKNFQNLHVSEPRLSAYCDMAAFRSQFANSSTPLSKPSPNTATDAQQEDTSDTPAWLTELLDKVNLLIIRSLWFYVFFFLLFVFSYAIVMIFFYSSKLTFYQMLRI